MATKKKTEVKEESKAKAEKPVTAPSVLYANDRTAWRESYDAAVKAGDVDAISDAIMTCPSAPCLIGLREIEAGKKRPSKVQLKVIDEAIKALEGKPDPWAPPADEPVKPKGKAKKAAEVVVEPEPEPEPLKAPKKGKAKPVEPIVEPAPTKVEPEDDGLGPSETPKKKGKAKKEPKPKPLKVESRRRKYETPKEFLKAVKICPHCKIEKPVAEGFGFRTLGVKIAPQPWCRSCRSGKAPTEAPTVVAPPKAKGKKKTAESTAPVVEPIIDAIALKGKGKKAKAEVVPEPVVAPVVEAPKAQAKAPKTKPLGYTPEQLEAATKIWKRKNVVSTAILKKHLECDEATARLLIGVLNKGRNGGDADTTAPFQLATSEI